MTVVDLLVRYVVEGVLPPKRLPRRYRVFELVPFQVEELDAEAREVDFQGFGFLLSQGRPWTAVTGYEGVLTPATVAEAAEEFVETEIHHPDIASGIPALDGRPWRDVPTEEEIVAIPRGADWRRSFNGIRSTDREIAVQASARLAARIRTIGGGLYVDRYEPVVVRSGLDRSSRRGLVVDLTSGIVHVPVTLQTRGLEIPHVVHLPHDESLPFVPAQEVSWASDVEWQADVTTLAADCLAGRLAAAMTSASDGAERASGVERALGSRAMGPIAELVAWRGDLRAGLDDPMDEGRLRRIVRSIRAGLHHADSFGMDGRLAEIPAAIDEAEETLDHLASQSRPALDDADAHALRSLFP